MQKPGYCDTCVCLEQRPKYKPACTWGYSHSECLPSCINYALARYLNEMYMDCPVWEPRVVVRDDKEVEDITLE